MKGAQRIQRRSRSQIKTKPPQSVRVERPLPRLNGAAVSQSDTTERADEALGRAGNGNYYLGGGNGKEVRRAVRNLPRGCKVQGYYL
jgi:hypothetical protein